MEDLLERRRIRTLACSTYACIGVGAELYSRTTTTTVVYYYYSTRCTYAARAACIGMVARSSHGW
jgi:hypothetical protein